MTNVPNRATFETAYAGKAPWDIGKPQAPFVQVADRVASPVLDAGCGTGDNALFFAARGHRVTGIDFLEEPIRRARAKATERGLAVEFLVKDALTLGAWDERFASVIDCGLFHVFSDDDRRRYVQGLAHVVEPGGRLFRSGSRLLIWWVYIIIAKWACTAQIGEVIHAIPDRVPDTRKGLAEAMS